MPDLPLLGLLFSRRVLIGWILLCSSESCYSLYLLLVKPKKSGAG